MELNTPHDYIEMAVRRKWCIIIPFVLVIIASFVVYNKLPKIYKATGLILVQPPRVPRNYVRPTETQSVADRLTFISQQILSRASLEQVITQLGLIGDQSDTRGMERLVAWMRRSVEIDVHRGGRRRETANFFEVSFEDKNPVRAARIVNTLAFLFVAKNQRIKEEESLGTSQFLEKELGETKKRLEQKQEAIRRFKEQYMGELPHQLDANLRILEQLRQQLGANEESLILAEREKGKLEAYIDQIRTTKSYEETDDPLLSKDPLYKELNEQKRYLWELETQYTNWHPDVIATKIRIEELEAQIRERESMIASESKEKGHRVNPRVARLNQELEEVTEKIDQLLREAVNLENGIEIYQQKVDNAPKREEQMSTLQRDHNLLQEQYRKLLDKKIQAELARNLEETQKGEQFKILDPATPPRQPFKPDKRKVFGLALALGLGLGGGLAFLREQLDRSFHGADDVEQFLGFPVIATLPRIEARKGKGK